MRHYLSAFDSLDVDSRSGIRSFCSGKGLMKYPVQRMREKRITPIFPTIWLWGMRQDINLMAFEVLDYALLSAPGAPLKQALLDAKSAKISMVLLRMVFNRPISPSWQREPT